MTRCGVVLLLCALFGLAVYALLAWLVWKFLEVIVWLA